MRDINIPTNSNEENNEVIKTDLEKESLIKLDEIYNIVEIDIASEDYEVAEKDLNRITLDEKQFPLSMYSTSPRYAWCFFLIKIKKNYDNLKEIVESFDYNQIENLISLSEYKKVELLTKKQPLRSTDIMPYEELLNLFVEYKKDRDNRIIPTYEKACSSFKISKTIDDYKTIVESLTKIIGWKDSSKIIKDCEKRIEQIIQAEKEAKRKEEERIKTEKRNKELCEQAKIDFSNAKNKVDYKNIIENLSVLNGAFESNDIILRCQKEIEKIETVEKEKLRKEKEERLRVEEERNNKLCADAKDRLRLAKTADDYQEIIDLLYCIPNFVSAKEIIKICQAKKTECLQKEAEYRKRVAEKARQEREYKERLERARVRKKEKIQGFFKIFFIIVLIGAVLGGGGFGIYSCVNCAYEDAVNNGQMLSSITLETNTTNVSAGKSLKITAVEYPTNAKYVGINGDYPQDIKWYVVQNGAEKEIASGKTSITYTAPSSDFSIYAKAGDIVSNTLFFSVT